MSVQFEVETDGARLVAEADGELGRPALLLVHAGIATRRMWDPLVPALAERHVVIRYDTRGFGESVSAAVPYSNRADAVAVLDAAGVRRATLVGASRGGQIALDTALEHPARVGGLVLLGSGPGGWSDWTMNPHEERLLDEAEAAEESEDWARLFELELDLWSVGPNRSRADVDPEFVETARAMGRANLFAFSTGAQGTPEPLDPSAIGRLGELAVPALVLVGESDLSFVRAQHRFLADSIPGAESAAIQGSAHLPSVERPAAVLDVLLPWLERHAR